MGYSTFQCVERQPMEIGEECQRNFSEFKEHHAKIQKYYPTRFLVTNKIQKMKKRNNEREREGGEDHVGGERERNREKKK